MIFKSRSAKLGTPENPEVILPGESPRSNTTQRSGFLGRLARGGQILIWMASIALPAFLLDSVCLWLYEGTKQDGAIFAWIPLLFLALPAFLLTVAAVIANLFLALVFVANIFGQAMIRVGPMGSYRP